MKTRWTMTERRAWCCALLTAAMVAACGGGGGDVPAPGSGPGVGGGVPSPVPPPPSPSPVDPAITAQPSGATVRAGQSATFTVVASGEGLSYQWRRNGEPIQGATAASYTTPAATLADNGVRFDVVITNGQVSVTSGAVVLAVTAAAGRLSAGSTNRYLTNQTPSRDNHVSGTARSPLYVVDPNDPTKQVRLTQPTQLISGGQVHEATGTIRSHGTRYLIGSDSSGLFRVTMDRQPTMTALSSPAAPPLAVCDAPYQLIGASADGEQIFVSYAERPGCVGANWYVRNVGPTGGAPIPLPGAPIELTLDSAGRVDGLLVWTPAQDLAYVEAATGTVVPVQTPSGKPAANAAAGATPAPRPERAVRTRGGILLVDYQGVVWRFDTASRSLSGPLWRQIGEFGSSPTGSLAVYGDAVVVAGIEATLMPGGALTGGDYVIWSVGDDATAPVRELARANGLDDFSQVRFTRNYVHFKDRRAEHVIVSRHDGSQRWIGPQQVNGLERVYTTPLSDTLFFVGDTIGSLQLDTLSRPTELALTFAGAAMSDEVPMHVLVHALQAPFHLPFSHLLAWRKQTGLSDLRRAELVWVDMATAEVVASSGSLPDADFTSTGLPQFITGHAAVGEVSFTSPSQGDPYEFVFGIAPNSLRTFMPAAP